MSRNPRRPSAQSPSTGARPSSSRPSSVKNSMAASRSSTTMPTLSIRLTVMMALGVQPADRRPPAVRCIGLLGLTCAAVELLDQGSCVPVVSLLDNLLGFEPHNGDTPDTGLLPLRR